MFEYSPEWYSGLEYHGQFLSSNPKPTTGDHPERDWAAYETALTKPNDHILICGCGCGDNACLLTEKGCGDNLTLVDFSAAAVGFCKRVFSKATCYMADVSSMPFLSDGSFDLVSALDVTEHLPHDVYLMFLKEIYRLCRPGGRVLILPGLTKRPEHINIVYPMAAAHDLMKVGFKRFSLAQQWVVAWREA